MIEKYYDTVIIGNGIIGLSCALEEALEGKSVCVIDKNIVGQNNASWASSGTLIKRDPRKFYSELREFCVQSINLFPSWLQKIQTHSGIQVPLATVPCYYFFNMDADDGEKEYKIFWSQTSRELAQNFEILEHPPHFIQQHLTGTYKTVVFPNESYVDNRILLEALAKACIHLNVKIIQGNIHIIHTEKDIVTIQFSENTLRTKHCLIATGAWCNEILHHLNLSINMIPVKGQMLLMPKFYSEDAMLYFQRDIYIVPKGDHIIVGTTQEKHIWQDDFNEIGEKYIQKYLQKYFTNITTNITDTRAGIRSLLKDRYPIMGFVNENKSISICSGHYKIGIAAAPLTAQYMSRSINNKSTGVSLDLHNLRPWRPHGLQKK